MKENKEIWFCVNEAYTNYGKGDSPEEAFDNLGEVIAYGIEFADCTFYKAVEVKKKMYILNKRKENKC